MTTNDRPDDNAQPSGQRSDTSREPRADVLLTDDGAFAVLPDGQRIALPTIAAEFVAEALRARALATQPRDHGGAGGHAASIPTAAPELQGVLRRARASTEPPRRSPLTGRIKRARGMTETEVKAEADMLHAERMTRREIARCLKRKGYPVRQALSVGMTYIQAERLVNGSRPLRGTDAAIAASDALKASMICDEIWKLCDYPTIRKRSAEVTDSPLDDLTKAEPSAA